ncbi:zf-HC2 domain-containing protein [Chloroflexota bacterium]
MKEEELNCRKICELLPAYLDGEVTHEEKANIEAHLSGCPECRAELEVLSTVQEDLRAALKLATDGVLPSIRTWEQVRNRLGIRSNSHSMLQSLLSSKTLWRFAAVTFVIIIAATVFVWRFGRFGGAPAEEESVSVGEVMEEEETSPVISESETSSDLPRRSGGIGTVSRAFGFDNLTEMSAFSDLIAVCVVDRAVEVKQEGEHVPYYMTRWAFKVEQILKGEDTGEIAIWQFGSPDVPGSDMSDDPLFLPGERYLLFLIESPAGTYYYPGPCGRYLIWKDKVYSMNFILMSGGYRPIELNYYGVDFDTITGRITDIVDSIQLIFTTRREPRMPTDVMRYPAGVTLDVYANLSTGNNGPGNITYKINHELLPDGITVSIRPAEFDAEPETEYESTLIIIVAQDIPPGTYYITVEYDFEGVGSGSRNITLHIESPE